MARRVKSEYIGYRVTEEQKQVIQDVADFFPQFEDLSDFLRQTIAEAVRRRLKTMEENTETKEVT